MTKDPKIDISKPGGGWKRHLRFLVGIFSIFVCIVGWGYLKKKNRTIEQEEQKEIIIAQQIDPDFFKGVSAQAPEEEKAPIDIALGADRNAPLVPVIDNADRGGDSPPPPASPTLEKKIPPRPEDLFNFTNIPSQKEAHVNALRRGAAEISVKVKAQGGKEADEEEKTEVVGEWKEPKTKASLPIDMSRVLTMDRFIPAILIPEIHSEIGGKVVAQVEHHVFGAHGRKILIPAGTKAIGRYKPLKKVGEERLALVWYRLITPDGINIHCGDAEMADSMGRVGITGDVDRRFKERYGMSLLVSAFTALTTYSMPVRNENQQLVIESFGKGQSSLAKTILEEHMEIKPKVTIPYGSRIFISVTQDIWFKQISENETLILPTEADNG